MLRLTFRNICLFTAFLLPRRADSECRSPFLAHGGEMGGGCAAVSSSCGALQCLLAGGFLFRDHDSPIVTLDSSPEIFLLPNSICFLMAFLLTPAVCASACSNTDDLLILVDILSLRRPRAQ